MSNDEAKENRIENHFQSFLNEVLRRREQEITDVDVNNYRDIFFAGAVSVMADVLEFGEMDEQEGAANFNGLVMESNRFVDQKFFEAFSEIFNHIKRN